MRQTDTLYNDNMVTAQKRLTTLNMYTTKNRTKKMHQKTHRMTSNNRQIHCLGGSTPIFH